MTASAKPSTSTTRPSRKAAPSRRRAITLAGRTARDTEISVRQRVVPAPYAPGTFETVTVNRWVDLLEKERQHLEDADIEVGRVCQAMWERGAGGRIGSSMSSMERTRASDREFSVALAAEDAKKVCEFDAKVIAAVGSYGLRVLRRYLVEGQTFRGYVGMAASERMVTQEATYFRRTLKNLADALGAHGPDWSRTRAVRVQD